MARAKKTNIPSVELSDYVHESMYSYAIETITERAIPDVADGLKPVQRRVLFAASRIAANTHIKSARLIGETLGKYHPHGDASVNDAIYQMVTIHPTAMLSGTGNWGSLIDAAAAPRYTNVGLSTYGRQMCLPDYMHESVITYVPNYDDTTKEPILLPAPLPNILLTGMEGIAVGAATTLPAFTVESVIAMLRIILQGKPVSPATFAKTLKPALPHGGELVNTAKNKEQWLLLMTSSKARIEYQGVPHIDATKKQIIVSQWPPGADPIRIMEKIRALPECGKVWTSKGSVTFTIPLKSGCTIEQFHKLAEQVTTLCKTARSYNMNVTKRVAVQRNGLTSYDTTLHAMSVPEMFKAWLTFRLDIERKVLLHQQQQLQAQIDHSNLMLYATTILDVIRKAWDAPNFHTYLCKHSKCTPAQATVLGTFKVEQLGKLSKATWVSKLKQQQAELLVIQKYIKNPKRKMLDSINTLAATLAKPIPAKEFTIG